MNRSFRPLAVGTLAAAALLCLSCRDGHALAGAGAWCIVTDEGDNHCNYATSQECLAAVASTRGGFCNENSTGGAVESAPRPAPARRTRRP